MKKFRELIGNDSSSFGERRSGKLNRLDWLTILSIILSGMVIYLTAINYNFFDPWENHYGQVVRETLDHDAFFRLWYSNSNRFWSKPPLLFWMVMPFFKIHISEFMGRFPIILLSLSGLAGMYIMLSRLFTRRAALFSTFVLMMAPQYFQLSRQVMVDLPFIAFNTLAVIAMATYYFGDFKEDDNAKIGIKKLSFYIPRADLYLYLFYFFEGWAFLAKGLLSIMIPGAALVVYMVISGNYGAFFAWKNLKKHLIGFTVYLAVIAPWVCYMWYDAGKDFLYEFFIFHHFKRVAGEIHKPNDLFTLYIRILGYATFPWVMFVPAAIYRFFKDDKELFDYKKHIFIFSAFIGPFFFLSFSSTKFHHYIAPTVPFLAIFIGHYLDGFLKSKWSVTRVAEIMIAIIFLGVVAKDLGKSFAPFIHMFTFFHERPMPAINEFRPVVWIIFGTMGAILFATIFSEKIKKFMPLALFVLMGIFMIYFFARVMPPVSDRYSLKPLYLKYQEVSPEQAPIADYYKWLRKSGQFWFNNKITFLSTDKENSVLRFFDKAGVQYVILRDNDRKRLDNLLKRINKKSEFITSCPGNILLRITGAGTGQGTGNADKYKVSAAPSDIQPVSAIFDNDIELIGYKIVQGSATPAPGSAVKFEMYFKSLSDKIQKDYMVFNHNEGDMNDARTKGDDLMANGNYATTYWKKGDIVRHDLTVNIPTDSKNNYYKVYVGLYQEEYRANVSNFKDIKTDGDNRVDMIHLTIAK